MENDDQMYRVTLIIKSDSDPSEIMDDFEEFLGDGSITCCAAEEAEKEGMAITVTVIDELPEEIE